MLLKSRLTCQLVKVTLLPLHSRYKRKEAGFVFLNVLLALTIVCVLILLVVQALEVSRYLILTE